ncbi:heterokaryon incompatibility protein Het-C-domain-containing protein [Amylocarpus encephaloides]|uniref:Heterokaryon incompatibility protein Het-C-domain-containing protein n=1 Tax=Amylocarpus encephaloides TaxID=45428 RepID=A0A9P8C9Q3_9HELO|nr:heterokaryon incompatibility protein Het-C-domain-containing protein [Amylocarpus encephaloides]
MPPGFPRFGPMILISCVLLLILPSPAAAFGAGNIPSISTIEGNNFRHGDIEDYLKTLAFIKGHKWTSMMIKRVYFGNWLRDYSQAVDVGSLKGVSAPTIRILVWVLSFLSFGYATEEFEVTEDRLGVYRPEEHIDNPKDYADNEDARQFDRRLRGPIQPAELEVDTQTGMKNYIANEHGNWATSTGYVKFSLARSIHFGRLYTSGSGRSHGKEEDLCEALRCLGQALHCLEDFGAHTNYCELALRELGYREVFPHTGTATEINLKGHRVFPLVTGTFGAVDFLHSVLGEATDHFTQTEVEEMDLALRGAEQSHSGNSSFGVQNFTNLISQVPGMGGGLAQTARDLQAQSAEQQHRNGSTRASSNTFEGPPGSSTGPPGPGVPGMSEDFDPVATAKRIYPILEFRDKVVRAINTTIAKIPGLESLVEKISETLTVFVLSLLAPFVRPIIDAVSKSLKEGSSTVVEASANQQFEPWNDPHCTNPTHSMLSKDHFSNKLNGCAGRVATTILKYVTPRVLYAWQNPGVPVDEVMRDVLKAFHHPAARDESIEIHRNMFNTVKKWAEEQPDRHQLNSILSSSSVKAGHNHKSEPGSSNRDIDSHTHSHGALGGHGKTSGSIWSEIQSRDLASLGGQDGNPSTSYLETSPSAGSPSSSYHSPQFGYANTAHHNLSRPTSSQSSGYLSAAPSGTYQGHMSGGYQQDYYQQQQQQQPQYGGPPQGQYNQGPPYPGNDGYGPPPHGGPPPQNFKQGPPYPPQQPPYGGGGGGYPGQGYGGGY